MKAVILAGGLGTRLRPITYEIPKPLVPVKKRPILNHLIEFFRKYGVTDVAILASEGHRLDFLRWQKAWDDEVPKEVSIFFEAVPRGTFGGMEFLKEWVGSDSFFFSNGDELKDFDLHMLRKFHEQKKSTGTIALVEVSNPSEYGVPILRGDEIRGFLDKPNPAPSNLISSGLYVLHPDVFSYADFAQDNVMIERDIFPKLAVAGKLRGLKMEGVRWYDCGTLERWERAIKEW